jgi:transposase-like protein
MEMTLEGVSTRKVSKITEQLCGTSFSKSLVSSLSADLDEQLSAWRNRPLSGVWPYIYVDALYEKIRHAGRVRSMAVLIVVGVNETGHRSVLAVEVCNSENEADYGDLFSDLVGRGLNGVKLVISDDHKGLVNAINRHFQGSGRQRCQVHFMRNLLRRLRKSDRSCVMSAMKDIFNAPDRADAERRIKVLYERLDGKYSDLVDWLEENITETLTVYDFPSAHHKRIRSTNGIERLNEEIRRRTRVIRIFPNIQSCLRMASALCQEQDEDWVTGKRYLDMTLMQKQEGEETEDKVRRAV